MFKNILFPIDLVEQASSKKAVSVVLNFAKAFDSRVHLMTVIPDSGMSMVSQYFSKEAVDRIVRETNKALHDFSDKNIPKEVKIQHIVSQGTVYQSIIDTAERIGADVIIMSAHRPELKDYLLGPNAARVVRHSGCSVLVVRE